MPNEQGNPGARTGRPPLTERRKAATRMDIARQAVRLFTTKGLAATTAEEIAEAAGVSLRTLWRYCPGTGKESYVLPLLSTGVETVARFLAEQEPGEALTGLLEGSPHSEERDEVATMLALVRLTRTEPAVRAVWLRAHRDAEPVFAASIAERSGFSADELAVKTEAAMLNAALRVAVEHSAELAPSPERAGPVLREALRDALGTLPSWTRS
ncbi:TetR/AcrR family transcriptional regulator [Actinopolyspora halophila]|uniref:TetR/AcrR family transcriptional regulator n=1 Tax=Actinopolyspora halophila TaxID=1850 RepID=UPI0003A3154C|nr:TetR/AcrR family transcriptional regulator [Actinopolyspora halophila]